MLRHTVDDMNPGPDIPMPHRNHGTIVCIGFGRILSSTVAGLQDARSRSEVPVDPRILLGIVYPLSQVCGSCLQMSVVALLHKVCR